MELALAGVGGVTPGAIDGDAHQLRLVAIEFFKNFVVKRQLVAANGAPVGWIKSQDDGAAA
jgi:hypothetical protein